MLLAHLVVGVVYWAEGVVCVVGRVVCFVELWFLVGPVQVLRWA